MVERSAYSNDRKRRHYVLAESMINIDNLYLYQMLVSRFGTQCSTGSCCQLQWIAGIMSQETGHDWETLLRSHCEWWFCIHLLILCTFELVEVRYEQLQNLKIFRWGMHGAEDEIAHVTRIEFILQKSNCQCFCHFHSAVMGMERVSLIRKSKHWACYSNHKHWLPDAWDTCGNPFCGRPWWIQEPRI